MAENEDKLPTVAGHILNKQQYQAVLAYTSGVKKKTIAERVGISIATLNKWLQSDWWYELYKLYLEEQKQEFERNLYRQAHIVLEGLIDVMRSRDPRTANARVAGAKLFMESGRDPIIKKAPGQVVNHNTLIQNSGKIDDTKLTLLSEEELSDMARTGIIPPKILKENNSE